MDKQWSLERFLASSDSDKLSTEYTVFKTELLLKHIVAFLEALDEVSVMGQDLEHLLEVQLNFIKMKKQEVT